MNQKEQKRRITKDMVNFALECENHVDNQYLSGMKTEYRKYRQIIDDDERSVSEITIDPLKYNWLMTVGRTIEDSIEEEKHTDKNGVTKWEKNGFSSPRGMILHKVETQGKHSINFIDPYYQEPY
jgi:hypothetical protein